MILRFLLRQIGDVLRELLSYHLEFGKLGDAQRHLALQLHHAIKPQFPIDDSIKYPAEFIVAVELTEQV